MFSKPTTVPMSDFWVLQQMKSRISCCLNMSICLCGLLGFYQFFCLQAHIHWCTFTGVIQMRNPSPLTCIFQFKKSPFDVYFFLIIFRSFGLAFVGAFLDIVGAILFIIEARIMRRKEIAREIQYPMEQRV